MAIITQTGWAHNDEGPTKSEHSSTSLGKKKRMTARSYRDSFKPKAKKAKSSGRVPEGDDFKKGGEAGTSKRVKMCDNRISVRDHPATDATSSSSVSGDRVSQQRSAFFGLQRMKIDSQFNMSCSCDAQTRHDSAISPSQGKKIFNFRGDTIITEGHTDSNHPEESQVDIQTDSGYLCFICNHRGLLLYCDGKGCNKSYHLSCLEPPLKDAPSGMWYCFCCLRKKMESGVYSVSDGMESVWDFKEEMQNEKQYLVKYKGLAHVHNLWVPESQMLREAPGLLAKFNTSRQKEKVKRWKHEWSKPHRLLCKRFSKPPKMAVECSCGGCYSSSHCCVEWFVKWKGLGYEHATWELESSPFLCSAEGIGLIKDYERHREEARKASDPFRTDKAQWSKKSPFNELLTLPEGCPPDLDNDQLNAINRILEFWHNDKNTILIDDQERIVKCILFILTLQPHTYRPFLVISTISSLSLWESEFLRIAPSMNVVVYNGNKDVRKTIQALEFYEEGGCILFHVLLSHPEAILEDLEAMDCIGWETIVVDECQKLGVSKHFEQFRNIPSDFRLLLLSSPLKDNIYDYMNLLGFLDPRGQENPVGNLKYQLIDRTDRLAILKERLAHYLAYECKRNSLHFVEYWVPVQLSDVQLEQYCAILLSRSDCLCSPSKFVHVKEALFDILISTRKCCDHPYMTDASLQFSLTKALPEVEYLDVGVNASGKLQLLDKVLQEIKGLGLRVLILFQSIVGSTTNSIGYILDDFLCQRFGADSYEYVNDQFPLAEKRSALHMFNDKARGRFVFLMDSRACRSSIRLSSVHAIFIFDSDWNPLSDLKALRKISIDSQFQQVKVFRLYSACTVEEKALLLAKYDMVLDCNIENISIKHRHALLSWGASYLFEKLDQLHRLDSPSKHPKSFSNNLLLNDILNLLTQSPENDGPTDISNSSNIVKAQQSGASYSTNLSLFGEKENIFSGPDPSHFWSKLLQRSYHRWRCITDTSQMGRRKVQHFDELAKKSETESDESRKKLVSNVSGNNASSCSSDLCNRSYEPRMDVAKEFTHGGSSKSASSGHQEILLGEIRKSQLCVQRKDVAKDQMHNAVSGTIHYDYEELEEGEIREIPGEKICSELPTMLEKEHASLAESSKEKHQDIASLKHDLLSKQINLVDKVCSRRLKKLLLAQESEVNEFKVHNDVEKMKLKKQHDLALDLLHAAHSNSGVGSDGEKLLCQEFSKEMDQFDQHMRCQRKELRIMQINARNKEKQIKDDWLEEAKAGRLVENFDTLPLSATGFKLKRFQFSKLGGGHDAAGNTIALPEHSSDLETRPVGIIELCLPSTSVPAIVPDGGEDDVPMGTATLACMPQSMNSVESAQPITIPPDVSATVACGIRGDVALETDTPAACSTFTNSGGDEHDRANTSCGIRPVGVIERSLSSTSVPAIVPDGGGEDGPMGTTLACLSKSMNLIKSVRPITTISPDVSTTVSCGIRGDVALETETPASLLTFTNSGGDEHDRANTSCGIRSVGVIELSLPSTSVPAIVPDGGEEVVPMGATLACMPKSINSVESAQSITISPDVSATFSCGIRVDVALQTETPDSFLTFINSGGDEHDKANTSCGITTIEYQQNESVESSGACLMPVLPSQTECHSFHASEHHRHENFASSNQVPHSIEQNSCVVPGGGSGQSFCCASDVMVPIAHSGFADQLVDPVNHSLVDSNPNLPLLSPSVGMASATAPAGHEEVSYDQRYYSTQLTEIPMQRTVVNTAARMVQSVVSSPQISVHPTLQVANITPENTRLEHQRTTVLQSELGSHLPLLSTIPQPIPRDGLHPDPFHNELIMLRRQEQSISQTHANKKQQIQLECEKELEKVRSKYNTLIQVAETEFIQHKKELERVCSLVQKNQILAEGFRSNFVENKRWATAICQAAASGSLLQAANPNSAVLYNNEVRPHFSPVPLQPHGSFRAVSELRAPAPHLHAFRPATSRPSLPRQNGKMMNNLQSYLRQ